MTVASPLPVAGLTDTHFHLGSDRTIEQRPKPRAAARDDTPPTSSRHDGFTLGFHRIEGPDDVHYPHWEMHPAGDELLVLLSGALAVELAGGALWPLRPGTAFVVAAGTWHRLVVRARAELIAITPRRGTRHDADRPVSGRTDGSGHAAGNAGQG